ncbi:hypothetical protein H6G64_34095 [Calothrix sp. FACHB-156]|nr:hypothetical protein [Calothrix sp. FACHB-156]
MKSESLVIALLVAILILVNALITLIAPIVKHCWVEYQHYRMIQKRRAQFYQELKILMSDRAFPLGLS